MKIDFKQVLLSPSGQPLKDKNEQNLDIDVTLGDICRRALLSSDEKSGDKKYEYYKLVMKIEGEDPDVTTKEITEIKDAIGKAFNVWVTGVAWDALEGK